MKTALTIAGSDSSGGAGIQADIKTMTANGVYAMSAVTALTAQNTTGVTDILESTPHFLGEQLDAVFTDIFPDAVKIGMVSSADLIVVIAEKLKQYEAKNIVVDPVMVATSGAKLLRDDAVEALCRGAAAAGGGPDPQHPRGGDPLRHDHHRCHRTWRPPPSTSARSTAAPCCARAAIRSTMPTTFCGGTAVGKWFHGKRINNPNTHGTGCTLSSAIASNLAKGYDLDDVRGAGQGIHLRRPGGHAGSGPRLRSHEPHVRSERSVHGMITSAVAILFAVGYLLATVWLCRGIRLTARDLCLGGIVCAMTLVLATIRIPLPTGSNITCGSWIPLMLLALLYDYRLSMLSGWVCGILAMILIPGWQAVHWAQIFVQQLVCFSCLGYAGVFGSDKRWKAICGMALAVAIRCFGHVISGVIFYSQNAWDGWGAWGYSLAFNLSSRLPEGILSILIVSVLPLTLMRRAIARREANDGYC